MSGSRKAASWTVSSSSSPGDLPQVSPDQERPDQSVEAQRCSDHLAHVSIANCKSWLLGFKCPSQTKWSKKKKVALDGWMRTFRHKLINWSHWMQTYFSYSLWSESSASSPRGSLTSCEVWQSRPPLQQSRQTAAGWACGRCSGRGSLADRSINQSTFFVHSVESKPKITFKVRPPRGDKVRQWAGEKLLCGGKKPGIDPDTRGRSSALTDDRKKSRANRSGMELFLFYYSIKKNVF